MTAPHLLACLNSYRTDLRDALGTAVQQGYRRVEASALHADLNPRDFGESARRHLRKYLSDLGVSVDVLSANFPGLGLGDAARAAQRLDRVKAMLELAGSLRAPRALVSLSGFDDAATRELAGEMLRVVADLSDRHGIEIAVLDPLAKPEAAAERVRALGCPTLRTALDTAHLAAAPAASAAGLTAAAYLRDVTRGGEGVTEAPFGEGQVDFRGFLSSLAAGGAAPALIVRTDTLRAVDALARGREYISSLCGR